MLLLKLSTHQSATATITARYAATRGHRRGGRARGGHARGCRRARAGDIEGDADGAADLLGEG